MAVDFIAGLNGGLAGLVAVHPLDTVKPVAIYKGMASPALTVSTLNAVVFGVYGPCVRKLDHSKLSHHFIAGSIAGLVQSPLCCLVELSKIRVQMQGVGETTDKSKVRPYRGSIDAAIKIFRHEGVAGCFRGLKLVTIRDVPGFGVYFAAYEGLSRMLGKTSSEELPFVPLMIAGGLSGVLSWASIYALDVVKTRFQADGVRNNRKYVRYNDVVAEIYHEKGVRGFFSGFNVTAIRAFPANAAIFGTVVLTHRLLGSEL